MRGSVAVSVQGFQIAKSRVLLQFAQIVTVPIETVMPR